MLVDGAFAGAIDGDDYIIGSRIGGIDVGFDSGFEFTIIIETKSGGQDIGGIGRPGEMKSPMNKREPITGPMGLSDSRVWGI